ncbi:SEC-C metal-binding domain-containing protein [Occallatibacter savannae]|uniref:SEC-C metal-binding domain-containing protein n=1 Tax=Occallatibacter savannae TaxID=1002691 RepID=UPI000D69DD96|nr:SEC-C metal-binding domain-containing protein [Occallatibacter savannae]
MRTEGQVFQELSSLCTSPGYVHALAYFCFRDSIIPYVDEMRVEDTMHLFSPERLIRTETSTLIGLMIQQKIDWTLPNPRDTQQYIDKTEELLKELHEAMFAPTIDQMKSLFASGDRTNPFQKGENLREPIFYCGESAYSFQFRDLSVPKYKSDNAWLEQHKKFSIEQARDVVKALIELQNEKFTDALPELANRNNSEWTLLPYFLFTNEELSKFSGLDTTLVECVVNAFVLPDGHENRSFRAIDDFNVASAMPIIRADEGRFLLLEQYTLQQSLYESPFFWMLDDATYRETAFRNRGKFVEEFSLARLQTVFGQKSVFSNVRFPNVKGKDEIDTLVLFGNRAIVVQAKSKRLTLEARKGNDNLIRNDFKKSVQDSYDQAAACARALLIPNQILIANDGTRFEVPQKLTEIYLFCVVSDHYPALSFQVHEFLKFEEHDKVQPPFVLDIFTLDVMSEMLDTPLYFLSYVNRRTGYQDKILAGHELTVLSYHLKHNLWFDKKYNLIQLGDDAAADLDLSMLVRREGRPGARTPDGILTRLKHTRVGAIIAEIESRPHPGTINLGLALLKLSENAAVNLSEAIDSMTRRSSIDRDHHDLTIPMGESRDGLTVHCNNASIAIAGPKLENHCLVRKYKARAERWYGICLAPDASVRFGVSLDFPWVQEQNMERILREMPRTGSTMNMASSVKKSHKIGRNELCPCGSGRKYKKCCLL